MKYRKWLFSLPIVIILFSFFHFFSKEQKTNENLWVGVGAYFQEVRERPNPILLDFDDSVSFNLRNRNYGPILNNDTLEFDSQKFFLKREWDNKRYYQFVLDSNFTIVFRKLKERNISFSFKEIIDYNWTRLISQKNETFEVKESYLLEYPDLQIIKEYFFTEEKVYTERESFLFDTLSYKNNKFLIISNDNYLEVNEVIDLNLKALRLFNHNSFFGEQKQFEISDNNSDETENKLDFKVCNNYNIVEYYYNNRGARNKRNKRVLKDFYSKKFINQIDTSQNGFVRIRFVVNCEGNIGRFSIQEVNVNYKETRFKKQITQQLFAITKLLDGWNSSISNSSNPPDDSFMFLTFKIKNGQIEDILP